jgi:osmotically-inducible protein OsmY
MARATWAIVAVGALVVSYVACENTWRGLRQDTEENTAIAKQKARDAHLDETARAVGADVKEAAQKAGDEIKKVAGNLRSNDEAPPPPASPSNALPRTTSRDVNEAIGKVAAKAKETGEDIAGELKGAAVHLEVDKALARDASLDASHVNVDIDDATHAIVLRGSVPNIAQKIAAERVATEHAHGYEVRNELATIPSVK